MKMITMIIKCPKCGAEDGVISVSAASNNVWQCTKCYCMAESFKFEQHINLKPMNDPVDRPAHYTTGKIETIEAIEDWGLGFHLGNAVKYLSRAGKKDPTKTVEDLKKAIWYINRQIKVLEEKDANKDQTVRE